MIDKDFFEKQIPAFRSPGPEVFNKMCAFIEYEETEWYAMVDEDRASEKLQVYIEVAVVLRAAYHAIPYMDLVLTPTGFGIVSNQSTAPASRERVEALREQLRQRASVHHDMVLRQAVREKVLLDPYRVVNSLLWHTGLATAYGVLSPKGETLFLEEFKSIATDIHAAHLRLADLISPELLSILVTRQYDGNSATDSAERIEVLNQLTQDARMLIASCVNRLPVGTTNAWQRAVLDKVMRYKHLLPEYAESRTAAAHQTPRYENKKNDSAFFFG